MLAVSNSVKNTMTNIETVINPINHGVLLLPRRSAPWVLAARPLALKQNSENLKTLSPILFKIFSARQRRTRTFSPNLFNCFLFAQIIFKTKGLYGLLFPPQNLKAFYRSNDIRGKRIFYLMNILPLIYLDFEL